MGNIFSNFGYTKIVIRDEEENKDYCVKLRKKYIKKKINKCYFFYGKYNIESSKLNKMKIDIYFKDKISMSFSSNDLDKKILNLGIKGKYEFYYSKDSFRLKIFVDKEEIKIIYIKKIIN